MALATHSTPSTPKAASHDLAALCRSSINDRGVEVRDCFVHAAENLRHGNLDWTDDNLNVNGVFWAMAELAAKGNPKANWPLVAPLMFARLGEYYQHGGGKAHGDKAVPGFSALLDLMGHDANEGRSK